MIIYIASNKINNKSYIGKTIYTINSRKKQHLIDSKKHVNDTSIYFHRSINKYGEENFNWHILWEGECSDKWLNELEKYYIYYYDTYNNGYNMTIGGNGGALWTKERISKKRRLEAGRKTAANRDNTYLKGENHWLNKVSNKERKHHVKKMLNARDPEYLKGNTNPFCRLSPEKRMESILKGNVKRKLYRASDETKKKMSETRKTMYKGRDNPMAKVYKIVSPQNKIFMVKDGLQNFCSDMGLSFSLIRKSISNNITIERTVANRRSNLSENTVGWRASECL